MVASPSRSTSASLEQHEHPLADHPLSLVSLAQSKPEQYGTQRGPRCQNDSKDDMHRQCPRDSHSMKSAASAHAYSITDQSTKRPHPFDQRDPLHDGTRSHANEFNTRTIDGREYDISIHHAYDYTSGVHHDAPAYSDMPYTNYSKRDLDELERTRTVDMAHDHHAYHELDPRAFQAHLNDLQRANDPRLCFAHIDDPLTKRDNQSLLYDMMRELKRLGAAQGPPQPQPQHQQDFHASCRLTPTTPEARGATNDQPHPAVMHVQCTGGLQINHASPTICPSAYPTSCPSYDPANPSYDPPRTPSPALPEMPPHGATPTNSPTLVHTTFDSGQTPSPTALLAAPRIDFMRTPILPVPFDDTTTALVAQINKVIESHEQSQRNFYYYMTEVEGHLLTLDLQPTPNGGNILRGAMLTTYVDAKPKPYLVISMLCVVEPLSRLAEDIQSALLQQLPAIYKKHGATAMRPPRIIVACLPEQCDVVISAIEDLGHHRASWQGPLPSHAIDAIAASFPYGLRSRLLENGANKTLIFNDIATSDHYDFDRLDKVRHNTPFFADPDIKYTFQTGGHRRVSDAPPRVSGTTWKK